jgi:hypothetical protein
MGSDDLSQQSRKESSPTQVGAKREVVSLTPAAGRLPTPKALADYAAINPSYPDKLMESFGLELKRNYQYQLVALVAGWTSRWRSSSRPVS